VEHRLSKQKNFDWLTAAVLTAINH